MKQAKKLWRKVLASLLAGAIMASSCPGVFAANPVPVEEEKAAPSLAVVTEIQAYTDETIYGTGVVEVEITYEENVDLSGITADSYLLEDRGSLHPDFGPVSIGDVDVKDNVVTLEISGDTAATEDNALVYTGDEAEGSRQRNAYGIYCTGPWYRDVEGVLYYGSDEADAYENNTTGMGYQARECLELRLSHVDVEEEPACLADDKGQYNEGGLWLETIDRQLGEEGFQDLYDLEIPSTAAFAADGTGDPYVRGYYYIPEDYDPADGIVFTLQGQGISYWQLEDGTNNAGTGFMYDSATYSWADKGAIVVNIHDRSSACPGDYWNAYDFVLDDVRVMKYFMDEYQITGNVVLQGNSRGTMASALVIKALAGQPYNPKNQAMGASEPEEYLLNREKFNFTVDAYICQNGSFGYGYDQEDWAAVAATGLKVWAFDGEQDSNNIEAIAAYTEIMTETQGAEWAQENIRLTGLTSQLFYPWGESDHSVTRINGWYFRDAAYYGPDLEVDEDGEIVYNTELAHGDKYVLEGYGSAADSSKADYEYTVYNDLFQAWALGIETDEDGDTVGGDTEDGDQDDDTVGGDTGDSDQDENIDIGDGDVADDGSVVKLPALVYDELEELMAEQSAKYLTADNVVPMLWQGLLEMDIAVGEGNRTAKLYVPESSPQGSMFVVMNVPEGQDTLEFMKNSGWMAKADAEDFCLFVLEPAEGTAWGEGADEAAYVSAAVEAARAGKWLQPGPTMYMVGYGPVGTELHKLAMENPLTIAGAVFMDASAIDAEFMETNGEVSFDTDVKTYGVTRKEVPVPVMIVDEAMDEQSAAVAAYWEAAASHELAVERFAPQGRDILDEAVVSEKEAVDYADPATTDAAWAFLDQFYRYGGGVLSNAISWKVDYAAMGVEFQSFTDSNGIPRQYLVYIPEEYRDSGEVLPVVVAYHGASTSMRNFFENTLWYDIADEEGVMLVFPESTLVPVPATLGGGRSNPTAYRPLWQVENPELKYTDVVYANELLDHLLENYAQADVARIYCTGHSMGAMMTHYLGSDEISHRFAAMGATSGPLMAREETGSQVVPMFLTMAEYDMWSYDLNQDTMTTQAVDMWLLRNGIATEENVVEIRTTGANRTFVQDRYHHAIWEDGNGAPLFRYAWVAQKDHVNLPAENQLLWNEWFSKWTLGEDGARTYQDTALEMECVDLDSIEELEIDWSQASQLPLTGYFSKELEDGRSVKVYIAEEASIRSYFTIVAVPDGVETWEFLEDNGWLNLADAKGEGLFILEPGPDGWGALEEEKAYVDEAISFLKSGVNSNEISVFSTFGEYYIAAYGASTPAVELWAANHPLFVISQVYVDGISAGAEELEAAGEFSYGSDDDSGYDSVPQFEETLEKTEMVQITNGEVPVPTWFVGGNMSDSMFHWMLANECLIEAVDGVHHQSIDAVAYQTAYANSQLPADALYGISQVKVTEDTALNAWEIYNFLSTWTRYDSSFAYSNALAYRLDYTTARVGAQQQAKEGDVLLSYTGLDHEGESQPVDIWGQESAFIDGHGTVEVGVFAFSDNNGDGENDPREYLVYVPQGFEGEALPVLFVYPGDTQTGSIFFDCTQWYQVADRDGIVLAFVNETYSGPTAITHVDTILYQTAMMTVLREDTDGKFHDVTLDFNRVYGTGQSLGSMTTQGFARSNPEFYAAVAATSGVTNMGGEDSNQPIPTFLMVGQSDLGILLPDLETASSLIDWGSYFLGVNGLDIKIDAQDEALGADEFQFLENRYQIYTWLTSRDVPVVQYGQTLMRTHDCYPGEMTYMWDFLKHFSMDEEGVRYYSESAFAEDDAVAIHWDLPADVSSPVEPVEPELPMEVIEFVEPTEPVVESTEPVELASNEFSIDVTEADWFHKAVEELYQRGQMAGMDDIAFEPSTDATRGRIIAILWTLEGRPAAEGEQFTDVEAGAYYANAILWATQNGIASGYGDETFGPDDPITQEQLAVILQSYAVHQRIDDTVTETLEPLVAADEISLSGWTGEADENWIADK